MSQPVRKLIRAQFGRPMAPVSISSLTLRSGGWKRKFSWTARKVFASTAAAVIALHLGDVLAERFLHDGRDAVAERQVHHWLVGAHLGDDIDEPKLFLEQHVFGVDVPIGHAELPRGGLGLASVNIANGNEIDALGLEVPPGVQVVAGKEAAPNDANCYALRHDRSLRRSIGIAGRAFATAGTTVAQGFLPCVTVRYH